MALDKVEPIDRYRDQQHKLMHAEDNQSLSLETMDISVANDAYTVHLDVTCLSGPKKYMYLAFGQVRPVKFWQMYQLIINTR